MDLKFQKNFIKTIEENYGKAGKEWLMELPAIVEQCVEDWSLTMEPHNYDLYYNFIAPVLLKDGREAILKIGFPKEKEVLTEIESLKYFPEKHSVRIFENSMKLRAFLLDKLKPGTSLREIHLKDDQEATRIALPLIREIPVAVPKSHHFPSLADWAKVFERIRKLKVKGDITPEILDRAEQIFLKLNATKKEEKLLHGDLHHDNILFDEKRGWIAIDPKGVIGDPSFHGSRFIINHWGDVPITELVESRINMIADGLGYDKKRIAGWAYVDYIISNCWTLEGTNVSRINIPFVEKLESLLD